MPENIGGIILDFETELRSITNVLNARIETEEDGIFEFYLLM